MSEIKDKVVSLEILKVAYDELKEETSQLSGQMEELTKELENDFSQLSGEIMKLDAICDNTTEVEGVTLENICPYNNGTSSAIVEMSGYNTKRFKVDYGTKYKITLGGGFTTIIMGFSVSALNTPNPIYDYVRLTETQEYDFEVPSNTYNYVYVLSSTSNNPNGFCNLATTRKVNEIALNNELRIEKIEELTAVKNFYTPSTIPCVVGGEFNVYFDNELQYTKIKNVAEIYVNEVDKHTDLYHDRWRWKPDENTETKQRVFQVKLNNTYKIDIQKAFNSVVVPQNAGSDVVRKVLIIGDSHTNNGIYISHLFDMFSNDVMSVDFIGTIGVSGKKHEGRSGWSATDYCNQESFSGFTNAFWNPNTSEFDFSYYMTNSGVNVPDIVMINLGTNDLRESIEQTLESYAKIITSIKNYSADIQICLWLSPPLSGRIAHATFKDKRIELHKQLIKTYGGRHSEGYFIVPVVFNVDPLWDFPYEVVEDSNHNEKQIIVTDYTHLNNLGNKRVASTIYYFLKYMSTL